MVGMEQKLYQCSNCGTHHEGDPFAWTPNGPIYCEACCRNIETAQANIQEALADLDTQIRDDRLERMRNLSALLAHILDRGKLVGYEVLLRRAMEHTDASIAELEKGVR
jgi:hypothetical protein